MSKTNNTQRMTMAFAAAACALAAGTVQAQSNFARETAHQAVGATNFMRELEGRHDADQSLRRQVSRPLNEAQALMNQPAAAAEKIAQAEAVTGKSPYERHVIARVKAQWAAVTGDAALAAAQYEIAAEGPWLAGEARTTMLQNVAGLYYNKQDYKQAAAWYDRYAAAGGVDENSGLLRAQSYYLVNDYANSARVLDAEVNRTLAASKVPPEIMLKLLANSKAQISDAEGSQRALKLLAQHYPAKAN